MASNFVTNVEVKNATAKAKIDELKNKVKELEAVNKELGKSSASAAKANAKYWKDWGDALKGKDTAMGKIQRGISDFGGGAVGKFAEGMGLNVMQLTKFASVGGVAVAVGAAFAKTSAEAVQKSAAFGKELSALSGITGVTGQGLGELREKIQQLGKDTNTGVSPIAQNFAQIGSALPELLKDTEGLAKVSKSAITLSKAGLMDLGAATDSLTTVMAQFGMSADDAAYATDVLANAAQLGSAGIDQVAATLQRCGTAASQAGLNINQVASMTEVLATKGLKGAEAGTALRNVFTKMSTSGIDQMNPKVVGLSSALEFLRQKSSDATWMVKTFGAENATAATILAQNIDKYNELSEGLDKTGTAAEMARVNFDNLMGDWEKMGVAWDNFMSSFNVDGANNPFRGVVQEITNIINAISELFDICSADNEMSKMLDEIPLDPFKELLGIITDLIKFLGDLTISTGAVQNSLNSFAVAWKALGAVIKVVRDLLWWVENAISYVLLKFNEFKKAMDTSMSDFPLFKAMSKWMDSLVEGIKQLINWYRKLKAEFGAAVQAERDKANGKKSSSSSSTSTPTPTPTPTPTTPTTTTSKTKVKDPIKDAEEAYAKSLVEIANERRADFITEKTAKENEVSALQSICKVYFQQEKLTKEQQQRLKELNVAYQSAKRKLDELSDTEKFNTAKSDNSKALSQSARKAGEGYITEQEMDKIISDAREKLIQTLFELKSPTEEQTQLLKDLIKESQKEKSDKINKELRNINRELDSDIESIIRETAPPNDLYKIIQDLPNNIRIVNERGQRVSSTPAQDKSNFGLTNTSYDRVKSENKVWSPELKGADKWIDALNKSLDKYAAIESAINKANAEKVQTAKAGGSTSNLDVQIKTHSDELDQLEKDIKKFKQKADEHLKLEVKMEGVNNVVGGLQTIGSTLQNFRKGFEDCEDGLDVFCRALDMVSGVIATVNAIMTIANGIQALFAASNTASAVATTAVATATTTKEATDTASVATSTAAAVAAKVEEAAFLDLAAAMIFAAHAYIPFAGVGIATGFIATMLGAMAGFQAQSLALTAFANGGVVKGNSFSGDNQVIRVNAGEMILNTVQQKHLFDLLDKGGSSGGGLAVTSVRIKGSDLYLALSNYEKIQTKAGRVKHL